jgi:hypothetical protein
MWYLFESSSDLAEKNIEISFTFIQPIVGHNGSDDT